MNREQAKGLGALRDSAVRSGAFGGGREAAMMGEYQATADLARAMQESQLRQQGFADARQARSSRFTSTTRFRYIPISTRWTQRQINQGQLAADQEAAREAALQITHN